MFVPPLTASDLAFVQGHPRSAASVLKPRLRRADSTLQAGVPVPTAAPAITGTVTVGQVLTCSSGTWTGSPTGYTYQWRRRVPGSIPGATTGTYTLAAADSGYNVECYVTATNAAGNTTTGSNFVAVP